MDNLSRSRAVCRGGISPTLFANAFGDGDQNRR
jgi:hypothetical protein